MYTIGIKIWFLVVRKKTSFKVYMSLNENSMSYYLFSHYYHWERMPNIDLNGILNIGVDYSSSFNYTITGLFSN